ncbi:MAG: hypothetical protein IKL68_00340 [Clostridia bacterium]|nr:hypothetical protein [Clostridia bacterium]
MLKKLVREYILKNKYDLFVILIMLLIGIIVGIGVYAFSDSSIKEALITEATEVFKISTGKEYLETNVVFNGIKTNLILILIFAMASVTLFGRYVIEMLAVIKGAMISIYAVILFNVFGLGGGMLVVFLLVVLVNVIYIPAYIFLSVMFMEVHFNIFKKRAGMTGLEFLGYIAKSAGSFIIIFSSIIAEQMASLVALKLFLNMK